MLSKRGEFLSFELRQLGLVQFTFGTAQKIHKLKGNACKTKLFELSDLYDLSVYLALFSKLKIETKTERSVQVG